MKTQTLEVDGVPLIDDADNRGLIDSVSVEPRTNSVVDLKQLALMIVIGFFGLVAVVWFASDATSQEHLIKCFHNLISKW